MVRTYTTTYETEWNMKLEINFVVDVDETVCTHVIFWKLDVMVPRSKQQK